VCPREGVWGRRPGGCSGRAGHRPRPRRTRASQDTRRCRSAAHRIGLRRSPRPPRRGPRASRARRRTAPPSEARTWAQARAREAGPRGRRRRSCRQTTTIGPTRRPETSVFVSRQIPPMALAGARCSACRSFGGPHRRNATQGASRPARRVSVSPWHGGLVDVRRRRCGARPREHPGRAVRLRPP
jgi:hypothetical protein